MGARRGSRRRSEGACDGADVSRADLTGPRVERSTLVENLTCNDHALNFAGTFADGAEFGVAIEFLYRVVLDETVASENLHRFVCDAHADFAGIELRHAGFFREARAFLIGKPRRVIHEMAGGFDLGGHVSKLELNGLKFADGLAKLFALFRILD